MSKKEVQPLEERKPRELWNTVMFFPDYHASEDDSVTHQFLWYFAQAKTSLRICIYNFSFPELQCVIQQQFDNHGLIVEFVVGHERTAEQIRMMQIPCGTIPRSPDIPTTDKLMHHKFAVIDDEAVLMGSMNWTTEGFINNRENVVVSTNPGHVKAYMGEFYWLKKQCEDAKSFY